MQLVIIIILDKKFENCPYDVTHQLPQEQIENHIKNCSNKFSFPFLKYPTSIGNINTIPLNVMKKGLSYIISEIY